MFKKLLLLGALTVMSVSCDYFKQPPEKTPVARVNDTYLFKEDLQDLISENTSKEDSSIIVNSYINRWATQQLLMNQARINLSEKKQKAYERLIEEYKNGLYTEAYKNNIVAKQLDTTVSDLEYESYYDLNKDNFKLNDELLKVRYIQVSKDYNKLAVTKEKFTRFNSEDREELSQLSINFKTFNLNDSIWIKKEALLEALPVLINDKEQVLKKNDNLRLQDSLGVYLLAVQDVLRTNDIAPLSFIKPTLKQIILNKRRLELIKKLEKDITKDAIKNDDFETY